MCCTAMLSANVYPISKVLETAPKDMDKESLLRLAEAAVAYIPTDLLNAPYGSFDGDDYDDIKIFQQISEFASEDIQRDADFLYKLFFIQIKHFDTVGYKWSRSQIYLYEDLSEKGLLVYPEHRNFIMQVNSLPRKKIENGELVDDLWMEFRYPRRIIYSPHLVQGNFENDKEFLLSFTNHYSDVLDIASDTLRRDKEFVLSCVSNYGANLRNAYWKLRDDRDVVWAALFGPKKFEHKARWMGRRYDLGKEIGNIDSMRYAEDTIKKDKEFLFNVLMELERRHFSERSWRDNGDPPYEELKAMYFGHPKILFRQDHGEYNEYDSSTDSRNVNVYLINHWWEYSYRGKYSRRRREGNYEQVHYRSFVRSMLDEKLAILNSANASNPRKKRRTSLQINLRF